jgi:hypothetical protein
MIIHANTPEGQKAKIFNADGTEVTLPIKSYDTDTQTATHYEFDENGKIKMHEWKKADKIMARDPVLTVTKLEGSYAEIDGVRV